MLIFQQKEGFKSYVKNGCRVTIGIYCDFFNVPCSSSSKKDAADNYETKVAKRNDKKGESKASSERRANKILMVKRC